MLIFIRFDRKQCSTKEFSMINSAPICTVTVSSFHCFIVLKAGVMKVDKIANHNFLGFASNFECQWISREILPEALSTMTTILFLAPMRVGTCEAGTTWTFDIHNIHHCRGFAFHTTNALRLTRLVEIRSFSTRTLIMMNINHCCSFAVSTKKTLFLSNFIIGR